MGWRVKRAVETLPELATFGNDVREEAYRRGLSDQDIAEIGTVGCRGCPGIAADGPTAFSDFCGGFVHWPDCSGDPRLLRFIRRF